MWYSLGGVKRSYYPRIPVSDLELVISKDNSRDNIPDRRYCES